MKHGDGDRNPVRHGQGYHPHRYKRKKRRRGTQVDQAQQHLHDRRQHKGPDGSSVACVDFGPQPRHRDGPVTGKGPGAAGCCYCDGDRAEQCDDQDQECKAQAAAWRAHHYAKYVRESLSDRGGENIFERGQSRTDGSESCQSRACKDVEL